MLSYNDALALILAQDINSPAVQQKKLEDAIGYVLADDLKAPIANQPFDNSAMDGIAVRMEDIKSASVDNPVALEVVDMLAAGAITESKPTQSGQCVEIMTGAPIPEGFDAVIPVEFIDKKEGQALVSKPVEKGKNIRRAGEDFDQGEIIISKGHCLKTQNILPLVTCGISHVDVFDKPNIGVISTGSEIMPLETADLKPGQIYNSNGPYLQSAIAQCGGNANMLGSVPDDAKEYRKLIDKALDNHCDIIISTGAVSAGQFDFVPGVLKEIGAEIIFHKAQIRPGKPILFARLPDNGPLFFGLPGNPVSAAVGLRFFIVPLLRQLQQLPIEERMKAQLTHSFTKSKPDFTFFLKARSGINSQGRFNVRILEGQESFKTKPFTNMNGWVVASAGEDVLQGGDMVDFVPSWPDQD